MNGQMSGCMVHRTSEVNILPYMSPPYSWAIIYSTVKQYKIIKTHWINWEVWKSLIHYINDGNSTSFRTFSRDFHPISCLDKKLLAYVVSLSQQPCHWFCQMKFKPSLTLSSLNRAQYLYKDNGMTLSAKKDPGSFTITKRWLSIYWQNQFLNHLDLWK